MAALYRDAATRARVMASAGQGLLAVGCQPESVRDLAARRKGATPLISAPRASLAGDLPPMGGNALTAWTPDHPVISEV